MKWNKNITQNKGKSFCVRNFFAIWRTKCVDWLKTTPFPPQTCRAAGLSGAVLSHLGPAGVAMCLSSAGSSFGAGTSDTAFLGCHFSFTWTPSPRGLPSLGALSWASLPGSRVPWQDKLRHAEILTNLSERKSIRIGQSEVVRGALCWRQAWERLTWESQGKKFFDWLPPKA